MTNIIPYIANASGELDNLINLINSACKIAIPTVEKELKANKIDIIFSSSANLVIPEYGIGGYSPGPNNAYIYIDPNSENITEQGLIETLLHEMHHCMRWRDPGYGETLGEAMVSEGMASLYEEEFIGSPPIYASVKLQDKDIDHAIKLINDKNYDHYEWFFGNKNIPKWFGYSYGYNLCKMYAKKHNTNSKAMINIPAIKIINDSKN